MNHTRQSTDISFLDDKTLYVISDCEVGYKFKGGEEIIPALTLMMSEMEFQVTDILSRFQMGQKAIGLVGNPGEGNREIMPEASVCNVDGEFNIGDIVATTEADIEKIMMKSN